MLLKSYKLHANLLELLDSDSLVNWYILHLLHLKIRQMQLFALLEAMIALREKVFIT